jgi:hypothetical protein
MLEATLLALLGGVAAVLFARWAFALIIGLTPDFVWIYRLLPAAVDTRVMLFAAALIALAIAIYGVMPALLASRTDVRARLQPGGPTSSAVGRSDRLLVFGQAAIAVALLVTGALIVQSFVRFAYQPLGFNPYDVQQVRVELSPALLADPARTFAVHRAVYDQLRGRLSAPVTFSSGVPGLNIVNRADRADAEAKVGRLMSFPVADTFFDVFELTLTRGRLFDAREAFSDPPIVVIDERAAATLWPGEDPVGKTLVENTGRTQTSRTVIGVVREVRMELTERRPQVGGSAFTPVNPSTRNWFTYVRPTRQGPSADDIRKLAAEAVPAEFVAVTPLRLHERALGQPRFLAALLGALSLLTIALTIVGVFGVVNHNVARRTREVGIRVALGAGAANVYRLLLGRPVLAATAGAVAGLGVSWWWSRSLSALLYDVQPHDVVTYAATAAGVVLLVAAAALLPTWRASHIDPTMTLRVE